MGGKIPEVRQTLEFHAFHVYEIMILNVVVLP